MPTAACRLTPAAACRLLALCGCLVLRGGAEDSVEGLPAHSVERFVRELAPGLTLTRGDEDGSGRGAPGAGVGASDPGGVCLLWGPMAAERIESALRGACAKTLQLVEDWEVDSRCGGSRGVRAWGGDRGGEQARWRRVEAAAADAWGFGLLCCEALDVRRQLGNAALGSGGVDLLVHTISFVNTLEPLNYRLAKELEGLLEPEHGHLILASPGKTSN